MTTKSIIIAVLVVVVLGAVLFYLPANKNATTGQGRVVVGISDASSPLAGVTSIMMTLDKVEVQNSTEAWVTVSNGSKQYDLLQLKQTGAVALLADINLPVGTYNQIRLTISKVDVTVSGATQEAKLPSGTLKIVGRIVVEEGKTASVVLDFKADKSLHITGNGKYILAPVVNLQTKSDASVTKESDDTLKIDGGKIEDDKNVGMDEKGDTKDNFELNEVRNVTIQNFAFNQKSITVKKGTKVVWTNKDGMGHTVAQDNGSPISPVISTNGTYSYTFNSVGTFPYHCSTHPNMTGTVVVTD